jgi:uncharacterized repeat protein (TIGR03806 family)
MRTRTLALLLACTFWVPCYSLLLGNEFAEESPYLCQFTSAPPNIDGNGADMAWESAETIKNFRMAWLGEEGNKRIGSTEAKILWDRDYVYFWAKLVDQDLQSTVKERDGQTWNDDVFEVFLKPSKEHGGYYEFHVTPGNVQMDLYIPKRGPNAYQEFRLKDAFDFQSAVRIEGTLEDRADTDDFWEVEFRLAWEDFAATGGRPEPGETWTYSLCRYDFNSADAEPTLTSISPLKRRQFHDYELFLPIQFAGPKAPKDASSPRFQKRVPVTTSKVIGNPEPPLPYTAINVFPQLQIDLPIAIRHEPQSNRVWLITQAEAYGPSRIGVFDATLGIGPLKEIIQVSNGTVHYDMLFHPDYPNEPYLFVGSNGPYVKDVMHSRITRYKVKSSRSDHVELAEPLTIIEWPSNGHNGAAVTFGLDGMLYVTTGDGTSDSDTNLRGQDLTELTAKVLRIDVRKSTAAEPYKVPQDNPFVTREGTRPETWAYGLRNPWRITTDRKSGRIWVGQNGQDLWEQVYLIERGANYGWSVMEGSSPFYIHRPRGPEPILPPTADHHHSEARSLTGGVVYHGTVPELAGLQGAYVYGDYSTGKVWAIWHDGKQVTNRREIADTPAGITAFEETPEGELWMLDHLGKSILKMVPNSAEDRSQSFPRKLSQSGLFEDVQKHQLVQGAIPYQVNSPLWSDDAHKERWFVIPTNIAGDRRIEFQNEMGWTFPNGTVLIKSFALDMWGKNGIERRWIETRFMLREQNEWVGYSYRWNADGTDADLVSSDGTDVEFEVADSTKLSGSRKQIWHYPSRAECMVCHSRAANYTLGLQTAQMNRNHLYDGVEENQLALLERLGFFKVPPKNYAKKSSSAAESQRPFSSDNTLLPLPPEKLPRLANPYDPTQNLAARARAYLHSNCSSCHQPAGGGNAAMDLRYQVALENCAIVDETPRHLTFDIPNAKIVAPGKPQESVLLRRVSTRENGKMPQLATSIVDQAAVDMLNEWIRTISSPKNEGGN